MKISECTIGRIVTNNQDVSKRNFDSTYTSYRPLKRIGYISGLTMNVTNETIPLVKWSDEAVMDEAMHHHNLDVYKH